MASFCRRKTQFKRTKLLIRIIRILMSILNHNSLILLHTLFSQLTQKLLWNKAIFSFTPACKRGGQNQDHYIKKDISAGRAQRLLMPFWTKTSCSDGGPENYTLLSHLQWRKEAPEEMCANHFKGVNTEDGESKGRKPGGGGTGGNTGNIQINGEMEA